MSERYIPEHRRNNFKARNTFKPDELRRRREEQQVEIRKQKREENLAKRRGLASRDGSAPGASLGAAPDSDDEGITIESQVFSVPFSFVSLPLLLCVVTQTTLFPISLLQTCASKSLTRTLFSTA